MGKESDEGVSHWYSQDKWFSAYQFSINPVWGSKTWKKTNDKPPLPPLVRKMPGITNMLKTATTNMLFQPKDPLQVSTTLLHQ